MNSTGKAFKMQLLQRSQNSEWLNHHFSKVRLVRQSKLKAIGGKKPSFLAKHQNKRRGHMARVLPHYKHKFAIYGLKHIEDSIMVLGVTIIMSFSSCHSLVPCKCTMEPGTRNATMKLIGCKFSMLNKNKVHCNLSLK